MLFQRVLYFVVDRLRVLLLVAAATENTTTPMCVVEQAIEVLFKPLGLLFRESYFYGHVFEGPNSLGSRASNPSHLQASSPQL